MNTSAFPQEIGFDTSPLPANFIPYIANNMFAFYSSTQPITPASFDEDISYPKAGRISTYFERKHLIRSLEEVAKTPTGRAALRAFYYNTKQQQDQNPSFRYGILIPANCPHIGLCHLDRGIIEINKKNIQSLVTENSGNQSQKAQENASLFLYGTTVLHEAIHIRQAQSGLSASYDPMIRNHLNVYLDALPQALSNQLITESNNPILQQAFHIDESSIQEHQHISTNNPHQLTNYSTHKIQQYTRNFLSPIEATPTSNQAQLYTKWKYLRQNLYLKPYDSEGNNQHRETFVQYFNTASNTSLTFIPLLPQSFHNTLTQHSQEILAHCSTEQITALQRFLNGKQKFPEELFPDKKSKAYQAAKNFETFIVDIDTSFQALSELTTEITNGNCEAQKKDKKIKTNLKKRCGISLSATSQTSEPISTNTTHTTIQTHAQNITNNINNPTISAQQQKNMS